MAQVFQEMLADQLGVSAQEHQDLQIAISMPLAVNRSEVAELVLLVQNPYDVRIVWPTWPEIRSRATSRHNSDRCGSVSDLMSGEGGTAAK